MSFYSGTPKFCLGLHLFLLEESRTPVFKILVRSLLDVNDECLPKKTVKPKTLVFSMSAGGSAAHGSAAHHAGTPMDSQEESDLNPDAQAFQPANNSDVGTVNEPAS